jgi:hypothetical protein
MYGCEPSPVTVAKEIEDELRQNICRENTGTVHNEPHTMPISAVQFGVVRVNKINLSWHNGELLQCPRPRTTLSLYQILFRGPLFLTVHLCMSRKLDPITK